MTHLTGPELTAWFENGEAASRERVIAHLAECADCRRALSALATAAEVAASAPAITVAEAVPLGYAARKPAAATSGWLAWLHQPAVRFAGAAAVIVAVVWLATPTVNNPDAVRGSELLALSPTGSTNAPEFRWDSPFDAARYRLTIRDGAGVVIYTTTVITPPVRLDDQARARLTPRASYVWQVEALDESGEAFAESKPATFHFVP